MISGASYIYQAKDKAAHYVGASLILGSTSKDKKCHHAETSWSLFTTSTSTASTSTLELFQRCSTAINMSHIAAHVLRIVKFSITIPEINGVSAC
jgi:hypothetical protein